MTMTYDKVASYASKNIKNFSTASIAINDIVFEKRNEVLCFYCGRYNNNWRCPPRIPKCNYKSIFKEYDNALLVYQTLKIDAEYNNARNESSLLLHKALLTLEDFLLKNGNSTRISFIGGSCKLCKTGCASDKCRNPYQARIPLEATGVNVIKTAKKAGIEVLFPVKETIMRIGLLLW